MRKDLIELDGSEGGGQILRSALSLSMTSGQPLRIRNIRGRRSRPGLLRQHLTAVRARRKSARPRSRVPARELAFRPGAIRAGDYAFAIGSAGSCSLVLQTLLPALLAANGESRVRISGGTHNPLAPPRTFSATAGCRCCSGWARRPGTAAPRLRTRRRWLLARVRPARWRPQLEHPGARAPGAGAARRDSRHVGERELERSASASVGATKNASWFLAEDQGRATPAAADRLRAHLRDLLRLRPGRRQRRTGGGTGRDASHRLDGKPARRTSTSPTNCCAAGGAGSFTTPRLSAHLQSNRRVIERFLPVRIGDQALDGGGHRIVITSA
nr:RNA 3'-terminal phosphate cyclase [Pseudomonas aeruginosa]